MGESILKQSHLYYGEQIIYIKTYGKSLAQVLWMIGVRLVADTFRRVNRVEPVSLEELGRPRIDVVFNWAGVFKDLFINQMNLLDRAVKMVAELDEPAEQNHARKHAFEQAIKLLELKFVKQQPGSSPMPQDHTPQT